MGDLLSPLIFFFKRNSEKCFLRSNLLIFSIFSIIFGVAALFFLLWIGFYKKPSEYVYTKNPIPLFKDKELRQEVGIIINPNVYQILHKEKLILDVRHIFPQLMIRRFTTVHKLNIGGEDYWFSENVICKIDHEKKTIYHDYKFDYGYEFLPLILILIVFAAWAFWFYSKKQNFYILLLFYFILWNTTFFSVFLLNGFFFVENVDYEQWYVMAQEFFKGYRTSSLNTTFGNVYIYGIFMYFLNPENVADLIVPLSIFNAIVAGGGTVVIIGFLAYKLTEEIKCAHYTMLIAILFPFLAWIFHRGIFGSGDFIGKTMLYIGRVYPLSLTLWYQALLFSYNCMSDNLGFFVTLCSIPIVLKYRENGFKYILLGFVLGLGLCIRYTTALLLPAIFLIHISHLKKVINLRYFFYFSLLFIFAFLAFLPQLIDNYVVMDNFFQPPLPIEQYFDNTPQIEKLLSFSSLNGFKYFLQINFKIMCLAFFSLYFIRKKSIGFSLWLWLFCVLTFHSCLKIYEISPVRYIIAAFPCLYLSIGYMLTASDKHVSTVIFLFWFLNSFIVSPENPTSFMPLLQIDYPYHYIIPICLGLVGIIYSLRQKMNYKNLIIVVGFYLIYISGSYVVLLLLLLFYPIFQLGELIKRLFSLVQE